MLYPAVIPSGFHFVVEYVLVKDYTPIDVHIPGMKVFTMHMKDEDHMLTIFNRHIRKKKKKEKKYYQTVLCIRNERVFDELEEQGKEITFQFSSGSILRGALHCITTKRPVKTWVEHATSYDEYKEYHLLIDHVEFYTPFCFAKERHYGVYDTNLILEAMLKLNGQPLIITRITNLYHPE